MFSSLFGNDGAQEAGGLHCIDIGVTKGDVGGYGCALSEVHGHFHFFLDRWASSFSCCTKSPGVQSPTCKFTDPHLRWTQSQWCCLWTDRLKVTTWCRAEEQELKLVGIQCWWSVSQRHVIPASRAPSSQTGSLWSTCRWSLACSAGSIAGMMLLKTEQTGSWHHRWWFMFLPVGAHFFIFNLVNKLKEYHQGNDCHRPIFI